MRMLIAADDHVNNNDYDDDDGDSAAAYEHSNVIHTTHASLSTFSYLRNCFFFQKHNIHHIQCSNTIVTHNKMYKT